jgi:FtsP/CotA-like multicopper oxidase with cupredoxin domain
VNAAVSRPWLIKIKDSKLKDIPSNLCKIIATDGGYRMTPIDFPVKGLLVGVAERFDIVCDFTNFKSQTLFMWNDYDSKEMKGVPYFCYSHLIAKIVVGSSGTGPSFDVTKGVPINTITQLDKVLSSNDIQVAMSMANSGRAHRDFVFGRSNGHWVINGESWASFKLAATDIGQNTWEVWRFKTGGGWFHPVHVHLIDFFIIRRDGSRGLENYELMSSKDVLYLGPSNTVYVIARFGPHKGDYMFHCHNLIHEDNDMMRAMRIISGGLNKNTAQQYIANPLHNIIYNNWQYTDPMLGETAAKKSNLVNAHTFNFINQTLQKNLHRIFYPTQSDLITYKKFINPWKVHVC